MSSPLELFHDFSARGIKLWAESGSLKFKAARGRLSPTDRELLTENKSALLSLLTVGEESPTLPSSDFSQPLSGCPSDRSCPTCANTLLTNDPRHFWCASGHYDCWEPRQYALEDLPATDSTPTFQSLWLSLNEQEQLTLDELAAMREFDAGFLRIEAERLAVEDFQRSKAKLSTTVSTNLTLTGASLSHHRSK